VTSEELERMESTVETCDGDHRDGNVIEVEEDSID